MDGVQEIPGGLMRPFVQKLIDALGARSATSFALALPDGSVYRSGGGPPAFRLVFHSDTALLATMTRGHIGLLESYFDQQVDVEGELGAAFATGLMADIDPRFNPVDKVAEQPARAAPFQPQRRPGQGQCALPLRPGHRRSTSCGSTTRC